MRVSATLEVCGRYEEAGGQVKVQSSYNWGFVSGRSFAEGKSVGIVSARVLCGRRIWAHARFFKRLRSTGGFLSHLLVTDRSCVFEQLVEAMS